MDGDDGDNDINGDRCNYTIYGHGGDDTLKGNSYSLSKTLEGVNLTKAEVRDSLVFW